MMENMSTLQFGRLPSETGPVFLSQRGGEEARLTDSCIRQIIEKYAYLSKLDDLHPHSLRHTFAKNLINS